MSWPQGKPQDKCHPWKQFRFGDPYKQHAATGRPPKLDKTTADLLNTRVFIARTTNLFKRDDIAEGFAISVSTMHRYNSDEYRQYSRTLSQQQYSREGRSTGACFFCKRPVEGHLRCAECDCLLHVDVETCMGGGTPNGKHCFSCYDAKIRRVELAY